MLPSLRLPGTALRQFKAQLSRLQLWIIIFTCWLLTGNLSEAVRCFCDSRHCQDALCDGEWCLVGFESDVVLVQLCATDEAAALQDCRTKHKRWDEVCACQSDFCNTFSYLRGRMKQMQHNDITFNRGQGSPHESAHGSEGGLFVQSDSPSPPYTGQNQLIVLLVVVPLGVGAVAVFLVFVNYHCKMC